MDASDDLTLDERETRLVAAGVVAITAGHQDQIRGTGADLPYPAGFFCSVDLGGGRKLGGEGETEDAAKASAFTKAEKELGIAPRTRWTVGDQEPELLHDEPDDWAWRWLVRGPTGGDRPVIVGLTDTTRATIERGGGPVTPRARRAYDTRGRSLIDENLDDPDLPGRRIIIN